MDFLLIKKGFGVVDWHNIFPRKMKIDLLTCFIWSLAYFPVRLTVQQLLLQQSPKSEDFSM
jgi:hypothetical protein